MALMPRAGWLFHLLYPGRHLTSAAVAKLVSDYFPAGYFLIWLAFPVIGLGIGSITALAAWGSQADRQQGQGPGAGPGGPDPAPEAPAGGSLADEDLAPSSVALGIYVASRLS